MTIEVIKDVVGELSKDVKLNLSSLLKRGGAPGLTDNQIFAIALACAYWTKDDELVTAVRDSAEMILSDEEVGACRTAASLMAMNNIYYRFLHLVEDGEYKNMPARLRMSAIAKPGVEKVDFELYCLALSSLSGCGMCINAHNDVLIKAGVSREGIQSAVRIAAVINSAAQTLAIRRME